jgi:hypothetical protein
VDAVLEFSLMEGHIPAKRVSASNLLQAFKVTETLAEGFFDLGVRNLGRNFKGDSGFFYRVT